MFKIGDFSRLGQVSTRMLRHYDKLGLLVPDHVDDWTGYRYYTIDQLARLHRIIALKNLGLTLAQISELLEKDEVPVERLRGMLILKQSEIEREIDEGHRRLAQVEARLERIEQGYDPLSCEVIMKSVPSQPIASIRRLVPFSDMDIHCQSLAELVYRRLGELGIEPQAPEIMIYHNDEYTETDLDVEMAVAVDRRYLGKSTEDTGIAFRELGAYELTATMVYDGTFEDLPLGVQALLAWVGNHRYQSIAPMREVRLSGPAHADGKLDSSPVLELQIPVQQLPIGGDDDR